MNRYESVIDFGSKNIRLSIFDNNSKNIYSSKEVIIDNLNNLSLENSLNSLIRGAEKKLSTHIDDVIVLYDSPKYYSLDISIKKTFDYSSPLNKAYNNLVEEANFIVSQNNFKDQIIHVAVNSITINENKKFDKIIDETKIKSLILEIKFICLNKVLVKSVINKFKKINLKIIKIYCSSYVKTIFHKKKFYGKDYLIYLDIGFDRTSSLIFNNDKFIFFNSVPVGGNNITKDISKVLKLNLDYSEDLKIKFNKIESDISFDKSEPNMINPYSVILEKNISIDLLKKIIVARIDEIMELVVFKSNFYKNINSTLKPKLITIGGGSKLLSNKYNIISNKSFSELVNFAENDSYNCEAGFSYSKSDESLLLLFKKKPKKTGFFEGFFNLFSK